MIATSHLILKEIDLIDVNLKLISNNIVYVHLKDNCEININWQEKMLKVYEEITEGKRMHFLFTAGDGVSITKEARDNATKIEDQSLIGASAVVVDNLAYKLIANFYLKFNKPKRPYKVFSNKSEAVLWLKTIIL